MPPKLEPPGPKRKISFEASLEDILGIDWDYLQTRTKRAVPRGQKLHIAWVMSPPGPSSGGHQNIFRFIQFLEQAGHTCEVFLTSQIDKRTVSEVDQVLNSNYTRTSARISRFAGEFNGADVVFATGWETCYPVGRNLEDEIGLYFVQDYEPMFHASGSTSVLAENTYRMGLTGITAGDWLAQTLSDRFNMDAAAFRFGVDLDLYGVEPSPRDRQGVFFYARPVTARRGFELGMATLTELHRRRPDIDIHLAGWDLDEYEIDFPHHSHGAMNISDLGELYNKCDAALVLSMTNLSLLPNELLACGTIPVMNDGPNTRLVCDNPNAMFSFCEPNALADALERSLRRNTDVSVRHALAASVSGLSWEDAGTRFVTLVEHAAAGDRIASL